MKVVAIKLRVMQGPTSGSAVDIPPVTAVLSVILSELSCLLLLSSSTEKQNMDLKF